MQVRAHTKCIQTPSKMSTPTKIGQSHNLNSYARYVSSHQTVPKEKKSSNINKKQHRLTDVIKLFRQLFKMLQPANIQNTISSEQNETKLVNRVNVQQPKSSIFSKTGKQRNFV